jgi:DNA-binding IclR family transcriptional regulator
MLITQSPAHGLNILLLSDSRSSLFTVSQISKRLGFRQSKAYRLIRTLVKYGLLRETDGTARYSLGLSALQLGLFAQRQFEMDVLAIAAPMENESFNMLIKSYQN